MRKILTVMLTLLLFNFSPAVKLSLAGVSGWRVAQIERLSPEERERVKKNYEEFKKLSPEEKMRLKEKYLQFKQASPEERERLRENYRRFENMKPEEHRDMERNLGIGDKK